MFQICVGYTIYGFKDESGVLQDLKQADKLFPKNNLCEIYESNKSFLHLDFSDEITTNVQQSKKIGFK